MNFYNMWQVYKVGRTSVYIILAVQTHAQITILLLTTLFFCLIYVKYAYSSIFGAQNTIPYCRKQNSQVTQVPPDPSLEEIVCTQC